MPPWGRPLGRRDRERERERERWERYQQSVYDEQRVHEISSDEDRYGVPLRLGSKSKMSRSVSDELFFNDGTSRYPRTNSDEHLAYGERYESSEEDEEDEEIEVESPGGSVQVVRVVKRDQDMLVAQRALARIGRAKAKGKPAVNLTHEEIEALEKRYTRDSPERKDRARKRTSPKGKRSPSLGNGAWTRKKTSRRPSLLAPAIPQPKQRAIKLGKKETDDAPPPPGFMIPGPGGAPVYSPLGYYNAQPSARRTVSAENPSPPTSRGSSRSTSNGSRHAPTPYEGPPYPVSRHPDLRQNTSSRNSSLPDMEYDQHPYSAYQSYPPQGRRVTSGPPDVSYSNLYRRVPPSNSARGRVVPSCSDPNIPYSERGPSGLNNEYEAGLASEADSEDELAQTDAREALYETKPSGTTTRWRRR
ncbi:hypothetical protein EJ08DRAFT_703647 [Tothia fuscella]|uniref:Uncharacterized protein n=1 Tax=Tothia fuscella TaxID=1048955 RepID=A0A9P4NDZ4_9PEZI|nr:hypothetical protein EJ08DRAFT_703647 [Tothia fuscella]